MSDSEPTPAAPPAIPLCVDLDGTLIRSDVLVESVARMLRGDPLGLLRLPIWLLRGRARLKERVAGRIHPDPGGLPYDAAVLELIHEARRHGRPVYLVTATHATVARQVADHLALFDGVIATENGVNLKGGAKRDALVRRFGQAGFDYVGDSAADLDVWPASREALAVRPSARVLRGLRDRSHRVVGTPGPGALRAILSAIRCRQWVKNALVFLPLILAHRYLETGPLATALLGILSFSLGCSAVYVLNDLMDVEADRHHPVKCRRPFASGDLTLTAGLALIPLLLASSLAVAMLLPAGFLLALAGYFLVTTAYSMALKGIALVDVLILAALYTLRIFAGSMATGIAVSEWLLAFSVFFFLSLGAVKRYAELLRVAASTDRDDDVKLRGRGYFAGDAPLVRQMGMSSGYIAVLVLALYITSESVAQLYGRPEMLWLACPLALYWITRVWLLAHRGVLREDPVTFAVRDPVTWLIAALSAVLLVTASRGF